ncbi:hypothetical protein GCM10009619_34610 [Williamsia maris]
MAVDEGLRPDRLLGGDVVGDDRTQDLEPPFVGTRHEAFTSSGVGVGTDTGTDLWSVCRVYVAVTAGVADVAVAGTTEVTAPAAAGRLRWTDPGRGGRFADAVSRQQGGK